MSPERDWKAKTSLKQKYSLRKKLFQKGLYFSLIFHFAGKSGIQLSGTTLQSFGHRLSIGTVRLSTESYGIARIVSKKRYSTLSLKSGNYLSEFMR